MAESKTARRRASVRLGRTAIIVGQVSIRCGFLSLHFLQMALRSGLKSDGVIITNWPWLRVDPLVSARQVT